MIIITKPLGPHLPYFPFQDSLFYFSTNWNNLSFHFDNNYKACRTSLSIFSFFTFQKTIAFSQTKILLPPFFTFNKIYRALWTSFALFSFSLFKQQIWIFLTSCEKSWASFILDSVAEKDSFPRPTSSHFAHWEPVRSFRRALHLGRIQAKHLELSNFKIYY